MNRNACIDKIKDDKRVWDVAIIGGGSSGFGVALDAVSRGLSVVLIEKSDFGKGTSSRSTKLLHGGVRYLAQGNIKLVNEALAERGRLLRAAPHLSSVLRFVIPVYSWYDRLKYTIGLKVYDLMSGKLRIGRSRFVSRANTIKRLPGIEQKGLMGGIIYHDGQFDDARLLIALARTCYDMGATLINHFKVRDLLKNHEGKIEGLMARDELNDKLYTVKARMVVNATGVFADKILRMDEPGAALSIKPSQGIHLVFDQRFLGGVDALMIPNTTDGRVLFAVPWQGKLVVGTTDTLRNKPSLEPEAMEEEIDFVVETARSYLSTKPTRDDVLSVFVGLRPLAAPKEGMTKTKEISRSHRVIVSESNLVSIVGGKWTTFRKMGEDTMQAFTQVTGKPLPPATGRPKRYHGAAAPTKEHLSIYGSDAEAIKAMMQKNPAFAEKIHADYPYTFAEVQWALDHEMAITLEDVLSRRIRLLILDARAAIEAAPKVSAFMANAFGKNEKWRQSELEDFMKIAKKYLISSI